MMDSRAIDRFKHKEKKLLSWREVRAYAKLNKPVLLMVYKAKSEWSEISLWVPMVSGSAFKIGPCLCLKPKKVSLDECVSPINISGDTCFVYEGPKTIEVMVRQMVVSTPSIYTNDGKPVMLFIDEPSDHIGDRCLFTRGQSEWGSADIDKTLANSIPHKDLRDLEFDDFYYSCKKVFKVDGFEIVDEYKKEYSEQRKKKAPDLWKICQEKDDD